MTMLDPRGFDLPPIPSKRYFTIGEVSRLCAVKPHVLRYWEQEFPQLNPIKRRGNRRYYQRHEVQLIRTIKTLVHAEGFTISGARAQLAQAARGEADAADAEREFIRQLVEELREVCAILKS